MDDLISRAAAIRWVKTECNPYGNPTLDFESGKKVIEHLEQMPFAQPEQRWIPFKTRPLTKEEKHESVQYDEFYTDDGSYLDSGYEIGTEATAWMPLPEPYREERTEE